MKKAFYTFIAFSIVSAFLIPYSHAQTDPDIEQKIEETKRERDALLEEQKRLQAALNTLSAEGQTLQGTVKNLDAVRAKLANDLKITQTSINTSNLTIKKLGNEISSNEMAITAHRQAIKDSLQRLRDYDSYSVVFALLAYKRLDEVWADTADLENLQEKLGEEIKSLGREQEDLLQNKTAKERSQLALASLSSQLTGQKKVADATRTVQANLLAETRAKEAEYQKMLAENKARHDEFERQLMNFESQLKASDQTLLPVAMKGVLNWPLDNVFVTQYFGYTAAARLLYRSGTHNGVDFRASVGTPVRSVRGGIVKGMGNTDDQRGCYSYGRWVLIEHDNGLSSLYAHLSAAIIISGQTVTTGQIIGYSGGQPRAYGSGASTGPHLHLGIYATQGVRISQYVTSVNCKNVFIPLANPQDYLDPIAYLPSA